MWGGEELGVHEGRHFWMTNLVFLPAVNRIASANSDGTILVWNSVPWRQPRETVLSADRLAKIWGDLADRDGHSGASAIQSLIASPEKAVSYLETRVLPVEKPTSERLSSLLEGLGSNNFGDREKASREFEKLDELAHPFLRRTLEKKHSLEIRRRIEGLLRRVPEWSPEQLRALRAITVLERIGGNKAKAHLNRLAAGAPESRLTQEARNSLSRLGIPCPCHK
jgi:hypothetical protein